jgi:hypothetical protein
MMAETVTYQGEQALRATAVKRQQDFTFWHDYWRSQVEYAPVSRRNTAYELARVYREAAEAMAEVVNGLDEIRADRMRAKGLDPSLE